MARLRNGPTPNAVGSPTTVQPRSLNRIGTPRNGPSGSSPPASARASSNRVRITASRCGLTASIRAMAASTRSLGLASPRRTRSACAVASSQVVSATPARYPYGGSAEDVHPVGYHERVGTAGISSTGDAQPERMGAGRQQRTGEHRLVAGARRREEVDVRLQPAIDGDRADAVLRIAYSEEGDLPPAESDRHGLAGHVVPGVGAIEQVGAAVAAVLPAAAHVVELVRTGGERGVGVRVALPEQRPAPAAADPEVVARGGAAELVGHLQAPDHVDAARLLQQRVDVEQR